MSKRDIKCFNYKGKMYFGKQPLFTKIKNVAYDSSLDMEVGYLVKSRPIILPILSLICVIFSIYLVFTQEQESHYINIPKVISFYDNYLDINVVNDNQNEQVVDVSLLYKDIELFRKENLKPGEFVGTVEKVINLSPGSYTCKYRYVIHGKYLNTVRYYDVLLNVR